ncbi:MAG: aspartate 1-decarboxylase [candidate division WOR-3 bacterium]|nr:aspartate 1-decarboxylase [candidate division WOR-3 bacterium]
MMQKIILNSKIHRMLVTNKNINYEGSIDIDKEILDLSNIHEGEMVQVVNLNTGERFETYTIAGKPGSRVCALNGGAARKGEIGDPLLIMSYCITDSDKIEAHKPTILIMGEGNEVKIKK